MQFLMTTIRWPFQLNQLGLDSSDADNIPRHSNLMVGENLLRVALMFITAMSIAMQHHIRLVAGDAHDNRV